MPPAPPSRLDAAAATPGLRERKKIKTRQAIRRAAYRLFAEQGYDTTTVEQIAAAAEVSPSTFFRYFPAKEDVVLTDEYGALMHAALLARPAHEPVALSLRQAAAALSRQLIGDPARRAELLQRLRLASQVPAVRARLGEHLSATADLLVQALVRRADRPVDEPRVRIVVGAVLGGWQQAMLQWAAGGGTADVRQLTDRVFHVIAEDVGAAVAARPPLD